MALETMAIGMVGNENLRGKVIVPIRCDGLVESSIGKARGADGERSGPVLS
jgi:hypothetical protein